ncbi:hypothetical protein Poli38472_000605 [Pythium oligandrum]|uniref:HSF-type DNA-binding domain-containing protein n=1 Tax=Pythium oligandrum TaxID=41045 RepID=A0A8K1CDE8_PYTOL|nr:hypothetical protein Poli38472_000605 [Pythium oligandrum]|eukprot:TMW60563.1 hypothetical protein Poli38472_000605 [Pythium oligandrum]
MFIPAFAPVRPVLPVDMNVEQILSSEGSCSETEQFASPASPSASSASDSSSNPTAITSEMLKRGWIAPFLLHLHQMLRRENPSIIRWTEDGMAFQILDKEAVTNQILPKYFKNKNFASFQRQLNYFGFRKWSKARAEYPTYSREHFTRDNYSAMSLVKRQSKKSRKRKASDSSVEETSAKRAAVDWASSERCKPILPRPDAEMIHHAAVSPLQHVQAAPLLGSISPVSKVMMTPNVFNPFTISQPSPVPMIPALSATRKITTGCKLPSLRELSAAGALLTDIATQPRVMMA